MERVPIDDVIPDPPRALVISHEPYGGGAEVASRLVERGFELTTHQVTADFDRPDDAAPFPSIDGYDLIVPMGSVRSLVTREGIDSWIDEEIHLLRDAHDRGVPLLGVCFGGQLLALALGGSVERAPMREIGWYRIWAPPGVVNPVGAGPWLQWHYDRFEPPAGAEVLAVTDVAVQLFRVSTTVGTQFHPEVNRAHIATWLGQAEDDYLESEGLDRAAMLTEAGDNEAANIERCRHLVDWFLDDVAQLPLPPRSIQPSSLSGSAPSASSSAGARTSDAEFMQ